MSPAEAIGVCLTKTLTFSGRASRPEYWLFLPFGLALPVAAFAALCFCLPDLSVVQVAAFASPALLPLAAVTARRLTDSGHPLSDMNLPTGALMVFLAGLVGIEGFFSWSGAMIEAAGSPGGFLLGLILAPVMLAVLVVLCAVFLTGLFSGASLFGQMLLPTRSEPPHSDTPPNEVSP